MYAIKQITICTENRDMIPRSQLDLSGTPGHRNTTTQDSDDLHEWASVALASYYE